MSAFRPGEGTSPEVGIQKPADNTWDAYLPGRKPSPSCNAIDPFAAGAESLETELDAADYNLSPLVNMVHSCIATPGIPC